MAMETLYRIRCDEKDCGQVQGTVSDSRDEARRRARMVGWDLGPRDMPHRKGVVQHTDYCPRHKKREPEPHWPQEADR
jgi:hypothetical protein